MRGAREQERFPLMAGPVRFFTRHGTAANLLMVLLCIAGLLALERLNTQLLPTRENPRVSVRVSWPGASATDIDKAVIRNLEPVLRYLDGVEDFFGQAREGSAYMAVQFRRDMNPDAVLQEVQKAVDDVTTLPKDIDPPKVRLVRGYERVAKILVTGPFSEKVLKGWALRIRDGLLAAGIDRVTMTGARDDEIVVRTSERDLARYRLGMEDIARAITRESRDMPAGSLRGGLNRTVHGIGRADTAEEIAAIPLRSSRNGEKLVVGDVADVRETFNADQVRGMYHGQPAIRLEIQRTPRADTLETNRILHEYVAKLRPTLPEGLEVRIFDVRAEYLQDRIRLLFVNGLQGLAIVLVVLFLFLNARIAFWVAAGIPVAMLATLAIMWVSGQSINMFSLFALILTLGIIVDDAIVVGEHAATLQAQGLSPEAAAERGAMRMMAPVLAATLTTIVAFLPTFFFGGRVGDMLTALPLVVVSALLASLVECFLILPAHLRHALASMKEPGRFRRTFDAGFAVFRDRIFGSVVRTAFTWRYALLAGTVALLMVSVAMVTSGRLRFNFFPSPEPEYISASIALQSGMPKERTEEALRIVEDALMRVQQRLGRGERLVDTTFAWLGKLGYTSGDHLAQLDVQLTPSEKRTVRTREIIRAWKREVPPIPGMAQFSIGVRRHGGAPRDLEIRLRGDDPFRIKRAALEIEDALSGIPGIQSVDDDLPWGKRDVRISLNQRGRALGFSIDDVAAQVRRALEGEVVRRFARGSREITVRILMAGRGRGMEVLQELLVRAPNGSHVPLHAIATLEDRPSFDTIFRRDGKTSIMVGADIDATRLTLVEARRRVKEAGVEEIAARHGIELSMGGGLEEQRQGFSDLQKGLLLALALIYIVLAWVFESYLRPFIVMAIIPFGIIGMVAGHMVMGMDLTMLSLVGLLGLSGIIVNDSIILVARADERLASGEAPGAAATGAARDRLRAVLLTSMTTIGGLLPLLFEKSIQAQFLIPMAVTITFGLAAGTLLVLLLVPALYGILADLSMVRGRSVKRRKVEGT